MKNPPNQRVRHNTPEHFLKQLDGLLIKRCGMGYRDLPDVVFIDDYYEEDLNDEEFSRALEECASAILEDILGDLDNL